MRLSLARCLFSESLALLILEVRKAGRYVAIDDVKARPGQGHMVGSLHELGLAADLNLYDADGNYLDQTDDHLPIGEWWEQHGVDMGYPLRWGGRFQDGNHYSWEWEGKK